jgi:hypothetical protein
MPANTSTLANLFKEDYGPAIVNELNDATPELDLFEKVENASFVGMEHIETVRVNRNRGCYFGVEGGPYPTAGQTQLERLRIPMRYQWGSIQVTKQLLLASRSDEGALTRGLSMEMDGMRTGMRINRNYAIWGDGRAVRALVNGAANAAIQTLDAPGGFAGATNGSRFLNVGDWVAYVIPATGAFRLAASSQIIAMNAAGTQITLEAADNTTDNDYVVKVYGNDAALVNADSDYMHAPMGITGMVDDGTYIANYFGLNRVNFPVMNATVITGIGALSADILQRAMDVSMQNGDAQISDLLAHPSVVRAYLTISQNDRRYTGGDLKNPDVGTVLAKNKWDTGITFGGVPFRRCVDAPYGMLFGVDRSSMVRYVMDEGSWIDDDGNMLTRNPTAIDTFDAQFRIYDQFAMTRPNQSFRLEGITTNIVVVHRI